MDITEIAFEKMVLENRDIRIDSQYYSKIAVESEAILKSKKWQYLEECSDKIASFGAYDLTNQFSYIESGIPFLRCVNIKNGFANLRESLFITPEANKLLHKSEVEPEMVLLTMSGSVGNSTVALPDWEYPINSNQDIAKIATKKDLNPYYLSAFLGCKFGKIQMERLPVGSIQQHIFLWMIEKLVISRFTPEFESSIGEIVKRAFKESENSLTVSSQAEALLLSSLGLEQWQPPEALTYERSAREVMGAGRLDSEYFAPAKKAAMEKLAQFPGLPVSELFYSVRELWNPEDAPANQIVQNFDLNAALQMFLDSGAETSTPDEIGSTKKVFRRGDLLVSRLRSYLKEISTVNHDPGITMVGSSEFIVLRPSQDSFSTSALGLYLRSLLPQLILKWSQDGANHPRFNQDELLAISVPQKVIDLGDRLENIAEDIRNRFISANQLLEISKRAVEIAIEQSEAAALAYLKAEVQALEGAIPTAPTNAQPLTL